MSNDPQQNPSTAEESKPANVPESTETNPTPVAADGSDSSEAVAETSAKPTAQHLPRSEAESAAQPVVDAGSEKPSTDQAAPAKGPAIQIGSQRDAADKSLSPSLPKAVREAKTSETKIPIPERLKREEPIDVPGVTVDQLSNQWDEEAGLLDDVSMDDLMGASGDQQVTAEEIPVETRLKGTVDRIHRDDVFVNLTAQNVGVVSLRQFKEPPQPGQELDVVVNRYNSEDNLYELTVPGAVISVSDWSDIVEGAVVDAKITKTNTGGLECTVNGIRGFIPAGQVSRFRIENFEEYVDQRLQCVVTEANPNKRNLVLSHRAILEREQAEKREQLMQTLEVGNEFDGTVTKLMDFGAFVDIGGIEGLVHISKLSWDRVTHPKDVLEEQQKIKVIVEKIDPATGKIGLSYRDTLEHPWEGIETKYPVDSIVTGTVSRLAQFGAFVRLEPGIEGLVHISELAHYRVQTVKSVVNEGDTVEVKVLNVDREGQKISLSLKATQVAPEPKTDKKESEEAEEAVAETSQKPKSNKPLKGGIGRSSGGEKFGLKW